MDVCVSFGVSASYVQVVYIYLRVLESREFRGLVSG